MKIQGEQNLAHPREAVWEALIDPEVLGACVPGCQSFHRVGDNHYRASMQAEVGPLSANFSLEIRIIDPEPPSAYRLEGSVKAPVGFGRGQADVRLADDGKGGTRLNYEARLQLGGKLAQVGSRLLSGITRKIAAHFFARFADILDGKRPSAALPTDKGGALKSLIARPALRWAVLGALLALGAIAVWLLAGCA